MDEGGRGLRVKRRLVLAGAGHAHLLVLKHLARHAPPDVEIVLVTPSAFQYYSGMLPGLIAGHYDQAQCRVDLVALCKAASCRFLEGKVTGVEAGARRINLEGGDSVDYDLLSLDIGSETRDEALILSGARLLRVKPFDVFHQNWRAIAAAAQQGSPARIAVVGGGAAGVELAMAMQHALRSAPGAEVVLIAGSGGILQGHGDIVRRKVENRLARLEVEVVNDRANGHPKGLVLGDGRLIEASTVIAATGAQAPAWLATSDLLLDDAGFIAVDACHRSLSDKLVFAAGDIASRRDPLFGRSGVHAVRAGPVLAKNLVATLVDQPLITYQPRKRVLYLIACGEKHAVASWGGLSIEGNWVWHWKGWIDRRFIDGFPSRR